MGEDLLLLVMPEPPVVPGTAQTRIEFPGGSVVKDLPAVQQLQEIRVLSLDQEDTLEEGSPMDRGESHGQRSLTGYSLWGQKESDTT